MTKTYHTRSKKSQAEVVLLEEEEKSSGGAKGVKQKGEGKLWENPLTRFENSGGNSTRKR